MVAATLVSSAPSPRPPQARCQCGSSRACACAPAASGPGGVRCVRLRPCVVLPVHAALRFRTCAVLCASLFVSLIRSLFAAQLSSLSVSVSFAAQLSLSLSVSLVRSLPQRSSLSLSVSLCVSALTHRAWPTPPPPSFDRALHAFEPFAAGRSRPLRRIASCASRGSPPPPTPCPRRRPRGRGISPKYPRGLGIPQARTYDGRVGLIMAAPMRSIMAATRAPATRTHARRSHVRTSATMSLAVTDLFNVRGKVPTQRRIGRPTAPPAAPCGRMADAVPARAAHVRGDDVATARSRL